MQTCPSPHPQGGGGWKRSKSQVCDWCQSSNGCSKLDSATEVPEIIAVWLQNDITECGSALDSVSCYLFISVTWTNAKESVPSTPLPVSHTGWRCAPLHTGLPIADAPYERNKPACCLCWLCFSPEAAVIERGNYLCSATLQQKEAS